MNLQEAEEGERRKEEKGEKRERILCGEAGGGRELAGAFH